jgi:D-tyrosyl-tRNA(Tyr) deacylase
MRATIQRVTEASVSVDGRIIGQIWAWALIFLGIWVTDSEKEVDVLTDKILWLRFLEDENGKTNLSLIDKQEELLIISQFTLFADASKGRRPSFTDAARPEQAIPLYEYFLTKMCASGLRIQTWEFGAHMKVSLINDGPFTINLDTEILD